MELLLLEEKRGNLSFENSQSEAQVALSRQKKGYLKSERRIVKSASSHHEKCDHRDL